MNVDGRIRSTFLWPEASATPWPIKVKDCNLIEYTSNYSERTVSLWFYSKDEATDFNANIANNDDFKSFKYKAKLLEDT